MRYAKRPKYRLSKDKIWVKKEEDLTPAQLYEEQLRSKIRKATRH